MPNERISLIEEIPFNKEIAIAYALLRIREGSKKLEQKMHVINLDEVYDFDKVYMASFTNIDNKDLVVVAFPSKDGEYLTKRVGLELKDGFLHVFSSATFVENAKVLIEEMYR